MALRVFRPRSLFFIVALLLVVFLSRKWWLTAIGYGLIHNDGPGKADIAVVLAGDWWGLRIVKAGELVRAGYVPAALVSGPAGNYGFYETDLSIPFAVRKGFPTEYFIPFPNHASSTRQEAAAILPELRRRNVKSFLLVTSDYHTARARRIFLAAERSMGGGPSFRTVASPDFYFKPGSWWKERDAQRIAFFEWSKTFATALGM